ncbi:MAG TPA: AAA family ATPase, partial [Sphingomicrobium sp.]
MTDSTHEPWVNFPRGAHANGNGYHVPSDEPPPGRFDDEPDAASEPAPPKRLPFLWVKDFGDLRKPPPLRWLLHDVRSSKPFLRAGKCVVLGGDGGVGKGYFWLQVAVCIALGLDVFDAFRPQQSGRIAILAAEDDQTEIHHRLNRIANSMQLTDEEAAVVSEKIGVFPLAGEQVNLLTLDQAKNPQRTPAYEALVSQLADMATEGAFEWSFLA